MGRPYTPDRKAAYKPCLHTGLRSALVAFLSATPLLILVWVHGNRHHSVPENLILCNVGDPAETVNICVANSPPTAQTRVQYDVSERNEHRISSHRCVSFRGRRCSIGTSVKLSAHAYHLFRVLMHQTVCAQESGRRRGRGRPGPKFPRASTQNFTWETWQTPPKFHPKFDLEAAVTQI